MFTLGGFLVIVGTVFAVLNAMLEGHIKTIEGGGLILVAIVFLVAARAIKLAKLVALSITIYFFAKEYGFLNPKDFMSLMLHLLPLFMVLFGLFIILHGPFKK